MSAVRVKHSIRRGSSGAGISRSIELKDTDELSDESDSESVDDHGSVASSVPGSTFGGDAANNVPASTVANHVIEKLVIENNIFLKAALQLLDQRDNSIDYSSTTSIIKDGSPADVIMCGKLKKASSGTVSRVWKDKFVELRHGVLSYEDIGGWGHRANKKTVQLIVRQVLCRPSQKYHGHVFEIRDLDQDGHVVHHHSRKKLFMAESNDEMSRWIDAIRSAMIGSAGDFGAHFDAAGGEENHTVRSDESEQLSHNHTRGSNGSGMDDWRPLHTSQMASTDDHDDKSALSSAFPKMFSSARKVKKSNHNSSFSSEGGEGFSSEMKRFEYIKNIIHGANTPQAYRECLLDQSLDNVITIPVAYIKKLLKESSMSNNSLRTPGSVNSQEMKREKARMKKEKKAKKKQGKKIRKSVFGIGTGEEKSGVIDHNQHWHVTSKSTSIESSQAWKDLFRDSICINGDLVNGGVDGPEAMIGALVRHILLQVQLMREKWVAFVYEMKSNAHSGESTVQSEQEARLERAQMTASAYSDLDEGQCLSIARDILLSCNRTESGGDTYECARAMLCNGDFAVLTPHACAVDPMEIIVDVVESSRRRSAEHRPFSSSSSVLSGSIHSVHSASESPPPKDHPPPLYHHLSGINEGSPRNNDDTDGEEGFSGNRDSTTVETDTRSDSSNEQNAIPTGPQSHYPESLLNAAAASVKRGGRRLGDIDDYYDPAQLVLQSDIPGASAIPSNMLLMKEVSKRKKYLNQPNYIERSDSDNSISESTSGDSKSNGSEKDSDQDVNNAYVSPITRSAASHQTPLYQINCDDEVTVAVSELTMDTVPTATSKTKAKRSGSMTAVLRKNLGFGKGSESVTGDEDGNSPATTTKKRHSFFSSWSNTKGGDHTDDGSNASHGFSSPPPQASSHLSWKSTRSSYDDDASSVTDHRHHHHHKHHHDDECEEETAAQAMCIRIQVIVKSRYCLNNLDPQDNHEATWANITGEFHQHFFLKSNSNGRPAVSDRFVTIKVDDPSVGY